MRPFGIGPRAFEGQAKGVNQLELYAFIGDSKATGGVNPEPVWWDSKYSVVSRKAITLYRDDRVTGDESTLRFEPYDQHYNRFPGYGVANNTPPYSVGYDNSFMWYMRTNSTRNTGLMKWALGGSSLLIQAGAMNDWSPSTNEMYRLFVVDFANLSNGAAIQAGYYGSNLKAMFVSLGTNDCLTGLWNNAAFIAALDTFVDALRRVFGKPSLPIYWQNVRTDLSSHPSGNYTVTAVTQCQAALANRAIADGNFHVLNYQAPTYATTDGVHEDVAACEAIGIDIASIFISL